MWRELPMYRRNTVGKQIVAVEETRVPVISENEITYRDTVDGKILMKYYPDTRQVEIMRRGFRFVIKL